MALVLRRLFLAICAVYLCQRERLSGFLDLRDAGIEMSPPDLVDFASQDSFLSAALAALNEEPGI